MRTKLPLAALQRLRTVKSTPLRKNRHSIFGFVEKHLFAVAFWVLQRRYELPVTCHSNMRAE